MNPRRGSHISKGDAPLPKPSNTPHGWVTHKLRRQHEWGVHSSTHMKSPHLKINTKQVSLAPNELALTWKRLVFNFNVFPTCPSTKPLITHHTSQSVRFKWKVTPTYNNSLPHQIILKYDALTMWWGRSLWETRLPCHPNMFNHVPLTFFILSLCQLCSL